MVRITKNGVFFDFIEINEDGTEVEKELNILTTNLGIVSYLTFPAIIEEDVTMEDMMNILALRPETTDFIFDSSMGGHSFIKYWDEMKEPIDSIKEKLNENILYLEIAHETDFISEEDPELFDECRLRGFGKDDNIYSMEFSGIPTYKDLIIKLNTSYIVKQIDKNGKEKTILSTNKSFTMFEIFHAILYEMSFYGDSIMRAKILEEVLETLEIEPEDLVKLRDRNDIQSLKKDLQKLVEQENYEKAAELRDKIKKLLEEDTE